MFYIYPPPSPARQRAHPSAKPPSQPRRQQATDLIDKASPASQSNHPIPAIPFIRQASSSHRFLVTGDPIRCSREAKPSVIGV
ncbi:MAG TPA: hypothetical protein PLT34_05565 [Muribaculaceae bacterium]|nr:hypothetical protein [Muribaculaceae bacterium]